MKEVLNDLLEHQSLSKAEAHAVLMALASGKFNATQTASLLTVYMMRNITVQELEGFRDAMLELCIPVQFDKPVMDVCGTGGDGKNTFNISTLAAFVVAAAGQPVAKHGNYGVSSACGSSNVLEYFGYTFTNDVEALRQSLDKTNICFMHAPLFHPAMKNVAPIRRDLGIKTFFNMLGPMVNPALPQKQMVGVFSLELARQYGYLYQKSDKDFMIVHTLDGYDEISLTGPFKYFFNGGEQMGSAEQFGLPGVAAIDLAGGETVAESSAIFLNVLQGKGTTQQEAAVIANAGMALYCANQHEGIVNSIGRAMESLKSGRAFQTFKKLVSL